MVKSFYLCFEDKTLEIGSMGEYIIGRDPSCDIVLSDPSVSRRHARLRGNGNGFLLEDMESTNGIWFEGKKIQEKTLMGDVPFRLGSSNLRLTVKETPHEEGAPNNGDTMIFERKISQILEEVSDSPLAGKIRELKLFYNTKKESLANLAYRDELTSLYNRRYFDRRLQEEWDRSVRYDRPLAMVMIDIDNFKKYNDTWGHQKGDEVLRSVAGILTASSRLSDILCRYGGEEMVFILPETDAKKALVMADFCRNLVAEKTAAIAGESVTISLGVAERSSGRSDTASTCLDAEALLKAADLAMYRAKAAGRNRVSR